MLQLKNPSPFKAKLFLFPDAEGIDTVFTVIKATYRLGPSLTVADEQVPIAMADQHYADPLVSSVRVPSDVSLQKPGTDVVLLGSAWAPEGRPTWQMDVSVSVGPVSSSVRVFGERSWETSGGVARIRWVEPFTRMPLVWERAFGGRDETEEGPVTEPRNPVGTGFRAPKGRRPVSNMPLPNLEDPASLISSPSDAPAPAGLAPVAPHWLPRRLHAGTYDEEWQRKRAPYLPPDFNARFCHIAPDRLITPEPLHGGELVTVRGVSQEGSIQFMLPRTRPEAVYFLEGGNVKRPALMDTVILEPDANRLLIVWRAALACDKKTLKIREVEIAEG